MSSKKLIDQAKLNQWASLFADQKASGMSVTEWCLQNAISEYKYFYWKRKLKDEAVTSVLPEIVPLTLPPSSDNESHSLSAPNSTRATCTSCTSCTSSTTLPTGPCARILINGMTVEFEASAPESLINTLLEAVRHV